jgi:hypothetical protein
VAWGSSGLSIIGARDGALPRAARAPVDGVGAAPEACGKHPRWQCRFSLQASGPRRAGRWRARRGAAAAGVLGRESCHWHSLTESRHSKCYPPLRPAPNGRAPFVVGDGSFTPSGGRYAMWGISKERGGPRPTRDTRLARRTLGRTLLSRSRGACAGPSSRLASPRRPRPTASG